MVTTFVSRHFLSVSTSDLRNADSDVHGRWRTGLCLQSLLEPYDDDGVGLPQAEASGEGSTYERMESPSTDNRALVEVLNVGGRPGKRISALHPSSLTAVANLSPLFIRTYNVGGQVSRQSVANNIKILRDQNKNKNNEQYNTIPTARERLSLFSVMARGL